MKTRNFATRDKKRKPYECNQQTKLSIDTQKHPYNLEVQYQQSVVWNLSEFMKQSWTEDCASESFGWL